MFRGLLTSMKGLFTPAHVSGTEVLNERPVGVPPAARRRAADLVHAAAQAFARDLPDLLKDQQGRWVAYWGERCLGVGDNKFLLYQECIRNGYNPLELFVEAIEPGADEPPVVCEHVVTEGDVSSGSNPKQP
jgi:hypothetical protein